MNICCCLLCHLSTITSDQGPRNLSWQGANSIPVVSHSFEQQDSTIWLISTPALWENTFRVTRSLFSPSTNLTRGLAARWLFRVPPSREGTIHLQITMPSSGLEPRTYGTTVSVTHHYTGWAANEPLN
ncbi:hypothetical protein TNCV_3992091 [Trichonephila clavipes]|uniref:Uncharacterized protein n=1 Tax=Trichonephila clavipes TaxID=2585209 RepID=A0A8X6T1B4_TRICX|nr:hypothetical protein TNCV_3992091 [Trichonephila clavipes]